LEKESWKFGNTWVKIKVTILKNLRQSWKIGNPWFSMYHENIKQISIKHIQLAANVNKFSKLEKKNLCGFSNFSRFLLSYINNINISFLRFSQKLKERNKIHCLAWVKILLTWKIGNNLENWKLSWKLGTYYLIGYNLVKRSIMYHENVKHIMDVNFHLVTNVNNQS